MSAPTRAVGPAALDTLVQQFRAQEARIRTGGGPKGVERQHKLGRLTARERIDLLCDKARPDSPLAPLFDRNHDVLAPAEVDTVAARRGPGREPPLSSALPRSMVASLHAFFELGLWAAHGMYPDVGDVPAAGVVVGLGRVAGRLCVIVANDATVKAGAFFPATCKKVLRAQRFCMDNRLPILYLIDSAGVFLPMQDEIFPDEDDFGRIFRNNARISAAGIPQYAAIMGNCVAGGAYLPVMCDTILMTEGSGLYLAGPALVKAAIGQEVSSEELGGALMHAAVSGTIDYREPNDELCLERLRRLLGALGPPPASPFDRVAARHPKLPCDDIARPVTDAKRGEFDIRDLLLHLVDAGDVREGALAGTSFDEYKAEYGQSLVCGFARIDGWAVGIVANQKKQVRPARGPLQFGSVIYADSADKAARFILDCNQQRVPIVFLQDVNGFMVGRDSEAEGIIRSGAKLVSAVSNCVVPKITVIFGGSYGAGNYAMCGKAYDPRFIFAWPNAKYAVMGGPAAAKTLLQLEVQAIKRRGHEPDHAELRQLEQRITDTYSEHMDIRYAAARGWVDAIIAPGDTRAALTLALEAVAHGGPIGELKTGVMQV